MSKLYEIIDKPLSGEWGDEDKDGIGTLVLRTTNFTNIGLVDFDNVVKRTIPHNKLKDKYLRKGDIVIEKSGGSPNQPVGRVIYFEGEENKYTFNNFTSVLRVKSTEDVFSKFVFYTLLHYYRIGRTRAFQNKTTGILNLKLDRYIREINLEIPSLGDQHKIAKTLDTASELIALRKKQLAELDNLIKATFYDMFGDPVTNEKGWEVRTTIDYADCIVPGRDKPKSFTGGTPWVTTNDLVHLGFTDKSKLNIGLSDDEINGVRARIIPKGSVIITCVGDLGLATVATADMVVNQQLHTFQCHNTMNNIFFMNSISFQKGSL